MYRIIEYILFFIVIVLLQVFLFGNLNLSMYLFPLAYISFIILLPMETPPIVTLLLGLALGAAIDLLEGMAAINTIATLFTAFIRNFVLTYTLGKDVVKEGGVPSSAKLGPGRLTRYITVLVFIHSLIYFSLDALSWTYFYITSVKIILSTIVTVGLVYLSQMLLLGNIQKRGGI